MMHLKFISKPIIMIAFFMLNENLSATHPIVRNYDRKESGSGTQNWDIIQTTNDWMYFANNNGLLQFDGSKWNIYPISNYTNVRSVFYNKSDERIYAGAFNEFGYYSRNTTGKMEYTSLTGKIATAYKNFSEIWNIFMTGSIVYFQGDNYIFRYENDSLSAFRFDEKITHATNAHNSVVLAQQNKGVSVLNGNLLVRMSDDGLLSNKKVISIIPFDENKIFFITESHGLFLYNGSKIQAFQTPADAFLHENQIFCAALCENQLAIGTVRKGMILMDIRAKQPMFVNTYSGLQNNTILSIAFDKQKNIWLGLDKGIDYVMVNEPVFDLFGNSSLYGAGYASAVYNNKLYLGTNQGLYTNSLPLRPGEDGSFIQSINSIKGQIWHLSVHENILFCGSDHGCYLIDGNTIRHIPHTSGTWKVRTVPQQPDLLLGSSYSGFFLLRRISGKWQFSHQLTGFNDSGSNYEFDSQGNIWTSHWMKGLYRLVPDDNMRSFIRKHHYTMQHGLPANHNNRLFSYNDTLYVNTIKGIYQYKPSSDRFEISSKHPAFRYLTPYSKIIQLKGKQLWSFNNKVIKTLKINSQYLQVDSTSFNLLKNKLIPGFEHCNQLNDSTLLVGTEDGFAHITIPKNKSTYNLPLQVAVRKIYLTGITDSLLHEYLPQQVFVPEIHPKFNSIRFEFSASEYRKENELQYSHLLEPFDQEWSDFSIANSKEFTNLPKGNYRFRVKAKNMYSASSGETFFEFIILPRWYETFWAKLVYLVVAIGLMFILFRFIANHSEHRVEKMKQLKEKEILDQKERFLIDSKAKETEIMELRNQKLNYELRHKSQDLANSTMNVIRKNEIMMEIIHKLEKLSAEIMTKSADTAIQKQLKKMQEDIRKNIETDNNWKKFQENFDMVYENFLKRLEVEYPGLSSTDKKLCAYLKMELSSKDIAPLMNMSYRSVEMSRYRLRKKFDLSRETNLIDFLRNF